MGKLGDALRRKYKTPKDALIALGLDPSLLDVKQLAKDSKLKRGPLSDQDAEMRAARELHGEDFEKRQRELDRQLEADMTDDQEEERDDDREMPRWLMHDHETEAPPDEELAARRRWWMKRAGDYMLAHGQDEAAVRDALEQFPRNGLEHLGGALDEDVDTVMGRLEGMGGTATSGYEREPKAKDRRKMVKDRRMARRDFGLDRLTPKGNELVNYGDQPAPLAMDEATESASADSFAAFFPDSTRIKTNTL